MVGRLRSRFRRPGSLFLASCIGNGAIRFVVEFFRAGGAPVDGLKVVQWTVGSATLAMLAVLLLREQTAPANVGPRPSGSAGREAVLLGAILAAAVAGRGWFTPLETVALMAGFLPPILVAFSPGSPRSASRAGLAACLMAAQQPPAEEADQYPRSYYRVGVSGMTGQYTETCGGVHSYAVGGVSVGYTRHSSPDEAVSVRIQGFTGSDQERPRATSDPYAYEGSYGQSRSLPVRGLAGSARLDSRWVGLTLGYTTGDLVFDGDPQGGSPIVGLRVGKLSRVFFDGRFADHEPAAFPAPALQLGLGFGVGKDATVRAGLSDAGFFVGGDIVTHGGLEIEPFLGVGGGDVHQLRLAIRKRFGGGGSRPPSR